MVEPVEPPRELIEDILTARHDVLELARAHDMTPAALADWASDLGNQRLLRGLCELADLQTQVLLSRYRLVAASRLIRLATQEGEGESARRACVDLLKVDLKLPELQEDGDVEGDATDLARFLYGDAKEQA